MSVIAFSPCRWMALQNGGVGIRDKIRNLALSPCFSLFISCDILGRSRPVNLQVCFQCHLFVLKSMQKLPGQIKSKLKEDGQRKPHKNVGAYHNFLFQN